MYENGRVVRIEKSGHILVLPFESDSCMGCKKEVCDELKKFFWTENVFGLDLKPGQIVKFSTERNVQVKQGFFALGMPILGAFAGWFAAGRFAYILNREPASEKVLVLGVIIGFVIFALLTMGIRGLLQNAQLPKITEILDSQS